MEGMGMMQIQSLTLSNMDDQFVRMRWKPNHAVTTITNPITVDHTVLRQHLMPGLLKLLASNRHHDLPQSVYELGAVVRDHRNADRLAFLTAERSGGFAAVRGRVSTLLPLLFSESGSAPFLTSFWWRWRRYHFFCVRERSLIIAVQ